MSKAEKSNGFILRCDQTSFIKDILQDNESLFKVGDLLLKYTEISSYGKLLSFFKEVKSKGTSIGWELNLQFNKRYRSLYLAGIFEDDIYTVIGTSDVEETRNYFNDLMVMSNQQQNVLREALKESAVAKLKISKEISPKTGEQGKLAKSDLPNLKTSLGEIKNCISKIEQNHFEDLNEEVKKLLFKISDEVVKAQNTIKGN